MSVGIEDVVEPVLHVLDGPARRSRQRARQDDILVIEQLGAETAAGRSRHDLQLRARHLQCGGEIPTQVGIEIRIRVHHVASAALIVFGDGADGLQGLGPRASPAQATLHDVIRPGEIRSDVSEGVGIPVR